MHTVVGHALHSVSVRQALREGSDLYYLVECPDGQAQRIPRGWTDQAIVEPATPGARFTPRQLLALRRWLDDHSEALLDDWEEIESPERKEHLSGGDDEYEQGLCRPVEAVVSSAADSAATAPGHTGGVGAATLESAGARGFRSCQWEGGSP